MDITLSGNEHLNVRAMFQLLNCLYVPADTYTAFYKFLTMSFEILIKSLVVFI